MRTPISLAWVWLVPALLAACGSSAPAIDCKALENPNATTIQTQILSPTCALSASCHSSTGKKAGLDLSNVPASCLGLIGQPSCLEPAKQRAVPMSSQTSFVYEKLLCPDAGCMGVSACSGEGENLRMPKDSPPLPDCYIEAMRIWIDQGLPGCTSGP